MDGLTQNAIQHSTVIVLENFKCVMMKLHSKIYPIHCLKFMTKEIVLDCRKEKPGGSITARSAEKVDRFRASVQRSSEEFPRRRSQRVLNER